MNAPSDETPGPNDITIELLEMGGPDDFRAAGLIHEVADAAQNADFMARARFSVVGREIVHEAPAIEVVGPTGQTERFLARGGKVYLPPKRTRVTSVAMRLAASLGLGALLTLAVPDSARNHVGFDEVHPVKVGGSLPLAQLVGPAFAKAPPGDPALAEEIRKRSAERIAIQNLLRAGAPPNQSMASAAAQVSTAADYDMSNFRRSKTGEKPFIDDMRGTVRFDGIEIERELAEEVISAAEATGNDPIYLMALADKESTFRHDAKAKTTSAVGLFQMLDQTWLRAIRDFGRKHGLAHEAKIIVQSRDGQGLTVRDDKERVRILNLRKDPKVAALMAGEIAAGDRAELARRLGRRLTYGENYMAHFLGKNGAGKLIEAMDRSPNKLANAVFPKAAKANPAVFNSKGRPVTVRQLYAKIDRAIAKRLDRYERAVDDVRGNPYLTAMIGR